MANGKITVGSGVITAANVHLSAIAGENLTIGSHVTINRNCTFVSLKSITIGNHCSFGPNVCIYDHDHCFGLEGVTSGYTLKDVVVEDHCWIGASCIILKGTHIGTGSVIGAGCVVTGEIPPHSLVTTNRALQIVKIEDRSKLEQ